MHLYCAFQLSPIPSPSQEIEKALNESDIGINPSNDGEKIRLNIPPLTQDRRKELSKFVAKFAEDGKVSGDPGCGCRGQGMANYISCFLFIPKCLFIPICLMP